MVDNDHAPWNHLKSAGNQQHPGWDLRNRASLLPFPGSSCRLLGALFYFFQSNLEIDELVNGPHRFASATFSRAYNKGDLVGALNKRYSWAAAALFIKTLLGLHLLCKNPERQRNHPFKSALITLERGCFGVFLWWWWGGCWKLRWSSHPLRLHHHQRHCCFWLAA